MNKYVGATPGAREAARIAHRERVNAAAREWDRAENAVQEYLDRPDYDGRGYGLQGLDEEAEAACYSLGLALAAPRPWRSSRRPTPRRRYSREHRRGCERCRAVLRAVRRNEPRTYTWTWERVADVPGCRKLNIVTVYVRDPHGRGGA